MQFVPANGSQLSAEQAQRYGEAISALMEKKTALQPQDVVEAAKPKASPLHDYFEWDDAKAAVLHRNEQAKELMRFVHVPSTVKVGTLETIRVFHSVQTPEGPRYISLQTVMNNDDYKEQVVLEAYRELLIWKQKYAQYSEFLSIFVAIEELSIA